MDGYVGQANVDHFFNILTSQPLTGRNRDTIIKLMIAEEDKLGRDLEHLHFAEDRAAKSRVRVNNMRKLRDGFAIGSAERAQAEKVLANFESIHELMEQFCHRMRERVSLNRL